MASSEILRILADDFFPRLREEGFRGSGATLRRINIPVVHLFNLQRSLGGEGFYLNLGAHLDYLLSDEGDQPSPADLKEYQCAFRLRLDSPGTEGGRWNYPSLPYTRASLTRDLHSAWQGRGQQFFRQYSRYPEDFVVVVGHAIENPPHPGRALVYARIASHLGMSAEALAIAMRALESAPPGATSLKAGLERFIRSKRNIEPV